MGILDDAIREHLDLKRRRGADPTEIERAEREALGPVRRGPEVGGDDAPDAPEAPDADAALDPEAVAPAEAPEWDPFRDDEEQHEPLPPFEHDDELPPYEPDGPVAVDEPLGATRPFDAEVESTPEPYHAEIEPAPQPEPESSFPPHPADPPDPSGPAHLDQETEEYELEPEEEEEGDDVLESTPEFLQDAPDHDRLWFEQRPPRDFDFDG
jgi:hypothetical protein